MAHAVPTTTRRGGTPGLKSKDVPVTGGSSGIGQAIACVVASSVPFLKRMPVMISRTPDDVGAGDHRLANVRLGYILKTTPAISPMPIGPRCLTRIVRRGAISSWPVDATTWRSRSRDPLGLGVLAVRHEQALASDLVGEAPKYKAPRQAPRM